MNRRRPSGSPLTRERSSGANSTVRSSPSTSRGRETGDRFTRARLADPGTISSSTSTCRPARAIAVRTVARDAPIRTRGASVGTRWLDSAATYPIASTRLVLPCPFGPISALTPGSSASSTAG